MKRNIIFLFVVLLFSSSAMCYKVPTHQAISEEAVKRSILFNDSAFYENLGLGLDVESNIFPNSLDDEQNILDLIRFGVGHEDTETLIRPLNHFYDPQNGGRRLDLIVINFFLSLFGKENYPSPDWSLEDQGDISEQEFSYKDANDYFYKALTEQSVQERDLNWGRTFQSLGHVIHHIQDMAQPQHTRNDAHSPANSGQQEVYESYTESKRINPGTGLSYSGYPDIDLNEYNIPRKFWVQGNGKGLGEFSSHNFVSGGTNFTGEKIGNLLIIRNHPDYPLPRGADASAAQPINIQSIPCDPPGSQCVPLNTTGDITFIGNEVTDAYIPSQSRTNLRASSYGLFDHDLETTNFDKKFTLNRFNFDAAHEFLIPRAVAYSAGMINYFFRGKINLEYDNTLNQWRIRNESAEDLNGQFELYREDIDGNRIKMNVANLTLPIAIASGQLSNPITDFTEFGISPHWGNDYHLVFRGTLGQHNDTVIGREVFPVAITSLNNTPNLLPGIFDADYDRASKSIYLKLNSTSGLTPGLYRYKDSQLVGPIFSSCLDVSVAPVGEDVNSRIDISPSGKIFGIIPDFTQEPDLLGDIWQVIPGAATLPLISTGNHPSLCTGLGDTQYTFDIYAEENIVVDEYRRGFLMRFHAGYNDNYLLSVNKIDMDGNTFIYRFDTAIERLPVSGTIPGYTVDFIDDINNNVYVLSSNFFEEQVSLSLINNAGESTQIIQFPRSKFTNLRNNNYISSSKLLIDPIGNLLLFSVDRPYRFIDATNTFQRQRREFRSQRINFSTLDSVRSGSGGAISETVSVLPIDNAGITGVAMTDEGYIVFTTNDNFVRYLNDIVGNIGKAYQPQ